MNTKGASTAKKLVATMTIVVVCCMVLFACAPDEFENHYQLKENMSPQDLFELLTNAHSFSVTTEDCDYRLMKTEGFSIYEFGKYEAYFVKHNNVCHILVDGDTRTAETLPLNDEYYQMVEEKYFEYVEHVSTTYGLKPSNDAQLDVKVQNNEAQVKTIWRKSGGELVIVTCKLFGINETTVHVPEQFEDLYNSFE